MVTAAGCRLSRDGQSLLLTPLPRDNDVPVAFEIRWDRLPWKLPQPTQLELLSEDGRVLQRRPAPAPLVIEFPRTTFACRFSADN